MQIQLLGTSGCHLCDVAERLVRRMAVRHQIQLIKVDIALDDLLMDQYALQIPLIRSEDGQELGWPFDEEQLVSWLHNRNE